MTNPWQFPSEGSVTAIEQVPAQLRPPGGPLLTRIDALAGAVVAAVIALLGAPTGLIWAAISPHLDLDAAAAGSESAFGAQIAADGRFFFLTLVLGVATGVVAFRLGNRFGPAVTVGIAAGALAAAVVAAQVGYLFRRPGLLGALRPGLAPTIVSLIDFRLRAVQVLVVWPIVALAVFLVLSVSRRD